MYRLQQQGNVIGTDAKSFAMQDIQPIVGGSISTDELIPDSAFLIANDTVCSLCTCIHFMCSQCTI